MLGTSEFIAQVLPLFLQFIGIPIAVGIGYYIYKNYYQASKNPDAQETPQTRQSMLIETYNQDIIPDIDSLVESKTFDEVEDIVMTDKNQSNSEAPKRQKLDTSDLPPLDMLLGALDEDIEDEPLPPIPDAPPEIVQLRRMPTGIQHVQLNTGQIAPAQEVITILRDEDDGKLIIQVGDTAYRTLANDAGVKNLFTQVMKELAGTITKPDSTPPPRKRYVVGQSETPKQTQPKASTKPKEPAKSEVASIRDLLSDDSEPEITKPRPSAPPPPTPSGVMPGDLPSYKLDDNPLKTEKKGRFSSKTEAEAPPELDLAAAIETYLQYKLQHTPDYAGRQIHIHGTPTGAIRIQVDQTYYDFVDEVADVEVRQFLQDTIAEWQERQ